MNTHKVTEDPKILIIIMIIIIKLKFQNWGLFPLHRGLFPLHRGLFPLHRGLFPLQLWGGRRMRWKIELYWQFSVELSSHDFMFCAKGGMSATIYLLFTRWRNCERSPAAAEGDPYKIYRWNFFSFYGNIGQTKTKTVFCHPKILGQLFL